MATVSCSSGAGREGPSREDPKKGLYRIPGGSWGVHSPGLTHCVTLASLASVKWA